MLLKGTGAAPFSFPQILPFFGIQKIRISKSSGYFGYFEDQHTLAIQVQTPLWQSPMILRAVYSHDGFPCVHG